MNLSEAIHVGQVPNIHELALAATLAPSPDNNQPWRLVAGDQYLDICLDPGRSLPSDVNGMFDLTAIGAAVENVCIVARSQGLEPHVELPGDGPQSGERPDFTARIRWSPIAPDNTGSAIRTELLAAWLQRRHTSRRPYSRKLVPPEILDRLSAEAGGFPSTQVSWVTDWRPMWKYACLVGQSDRLRFEQEAFHQELFRQLRFSPQEAESTRDGLDLRVLDLPPIVGRCVLRAIRNWNVLKAVNPLGAIFLSIPSIFTVFRSGCIGMMSVDCAAAKEFVAGGRAFQRLWLAATAEGLQLHPLGSLPIFLAHQQLQGDRLTRAQRQRCNRVRQELVRLVPELAQRTLLIAFRIGYGPPARVRALRRNLADVLESPGRLNNAENRS
jgi:hypothetical protein